MRELAPSGKPIAVTSDGFSRQIINRHAGFGSLVCHFRPLISTGGIVSLLGRWIELVYAMPFLSIKQKITTQRIRSMSGEKTQPINFILNFLLNFSEWRNIVQPQNRLVEGTLKDLALPSHKSYFFQPLNRVLGETLKESAISSQKVYSLQPGAAFTMPVTSSSWLSRDIVRSQREKERQWASRGWPQPSAYAQSSLKETTRLATEETKEVSEEESRQKSLAAVAPLPPTVRYNPLVLNYQLPAIVQTARESAISPAAGRITASLLAPLLGTKRESREAPAYARLTTDKVDSASSRRARSLTSVPASTQGMGSTQRRAAGGTHLNILNLTKVEPIYRTYPVMETINSRENPQIIRETEVIEKDIATKTPPPPKIDIERLTEEVYRLLERKIRIERERRGL